MANKTTNFGLTKPLPEDFYDVGVQNENMDIIDEQLKKLSENTPDVSGQITDHNNDSSAHTDIRNAVNTHTSNKNNPHGVTAAQVGAIPTSQKGVASGVATLGSDGKVPTGQLPEISSVKSATVTLTASGWVVGTADERYYQTVNVPAVTTDAKVVMVDVDLSTDDADAKIAYLEAWALPSANEVDQGNGTLTFYAWDKPTVNIPVNVGVM